MPLTIHRQLKSQSSQAIRPTQIILHSLANGWNFDSSVGYLRSPNNPLESHYAIRKDGYIVQLVEETQRADANYTANRRADGTGAISIETDSDVAGAEPWTDAQLDAIVELCADICRRRGIPARLCPAHDAPGIGWHIMYGTPGWWTPVAKACPGPRRIEQTKTVVVPGVARALAGVVTPPVPQEEEIEMLRLRNPQGTQILLFGDQAVLLDPDSAEGLADAGVKRADVTKEVFDRIWSHAQPELKK